MRLFLAPGGPPTNIVVADETPTSLTVRWAPPSPSKRNGLIVAYRLEATSVNDYKTIVVPWFVLAYRFDNLRHRTLYLIDVSAATAGGFGPTGYYVAKTKNGSTREQTSFVCMLLYRSRRSVLPPKRHRPSDIEIDSRFDRITLDVDQRHFRYGSGVETDGVSRAQFR